MYTCKFTECCSEYRNELKNTFVRKTKTNIAFLTCNKQYEYKKPDHFSYILGNGNNEVFALSLAQIFNVLDLSVSQWPSAVDLLVSEWSSASGDVTDDSWTTPESSHVLQIRDYFKVLDDNLKADVASGKF